MSPHLLLYEAQTRVVSCEVVEVVEERGTLICRMVVRDRSICYPLR